jgi:hypothetical protein
MVVRRLWKRLNPGTFRRVPLGFNNLRTTMRVACLGLALMAASGQALAARTDVVSLVNGDSVTGEV